MRRVAAVPLSLAVVIAATGWLYMSRGLFDVRPRVAEALPLDELARHSDVPLLTFVAVWGVTAVFLGMIVRWAAKYGAVKRPRTKTSTSRSGKVSEPVQCSTGISTISGARRRSDASIVFRPPSRATTLPLGIPKIAIGAISAART